MKIVNSANLRDLGMIFEYSGNYTANAKTGSEKFDQDTDVQSIGISVAKKTKELYVAGIYKTINTVHNS